jgi:O-antigen/teichoic acid export membrane protein
MRFAPPMNAMRLSSSRLPSWLLNREHRALLGATGWSLFLRIAGMVVTFVSGVILARFLGPGDLGAYGIVIALALLLSAFAQAGMPLLATRESAVALSRGDWGLLHGSLRWFGRTVLATSLIFAALVAGWAALRPGGSHAFTAGYYAAAALVPLYALTVLVGAQMRGLGRIVGGQSLEILVRPALVTAGCLIAIVAAPHFDWRIAVFVNFVAALVALAAGLVWLRRIVPSAAFRARPEQQPRAWWSAAIPLAVVDGFKQLDATYAILLLGILSTASEAGLLRVAASLAVVIAMPLSVLNVVLAPTLASCAAAGETGKLSKLLALSAGSMFATLAATLAVLLLVGKPLLGIVFGEPFRASWLPLVVLTGAQLVNAFFGVGWVLLAMGGGERRLTLSYGVSVTCSIAVAIPAARYGGASGVAAVAILGATIQNLITWWSVRARYHVDCTCLSLLRFLRSARGRP